MVSRANYRWRDLGTRLMMCSTINDVLDRRRFRNLRWHYAVIWNIRTRRNFPQRHAWWAFRKQARRDLKKLSATNFDVIGIEFDLADDFATGMR